MYRFIETIRIEEGRICHASYHDLRMNETRRSCWGVCTEWRVSDWVDPTPFRERTRCRLVYGKEVEKVEYLPYVPRRITRLRLTDGEGVDYRFKYADRSALDALFAQRGEADDVLIVRKGLLTDTSIANVALWNGKEWHTPARPLLNGTCRRRLLEEGIIREKDIPVSRLAEYRKICLFNAMLHWEETVLDCTAIE